MKYTSAQAEVDLLQINSMVNETSFTQNRNIKHLKLCYQYVSLITQQMV